MRKVAPAVGTLTRWSSLAKDGKLTGVKVQEITWKPNPEGGRPLMEPIGKPEVIKAEMVLLAKMGFLKPEHQNLPTTYLLPEMPQAERASWFVPWLTRTKDSCRSR